MAVNNNSRGDNNPGNYNPSKQNPVRRTLGLEITVVQQNLSRSRRGYSLGQDKVVLDKHGQLDMGPISRRDVEFLGSDF